MIFIYYPLILFSILGYGFFASDKIYLHLKLISRKEYQDKKNHQDGTSQRNSFVAIEIQTYTTEFKGIKY